jgi:hypothetical protein
MQQRPMGTPGPRARHGWRLRPCCSLALSRAWQAAGSCSAAVARIQKLRKQPRLVRTAHRHATGVPPTHRPAAPQVVPPPGPVSGPTMQCDRLVRRRSRVPRPRRLRLQRRDRRRNRVRLSLPLREPRHHLSRLRRVDVSSSARVRRVPASKSVGGTGANRPPRSPICPTDGTPCASAEAGTRPSNSG